MTSHGGPRHGRYERLLRKHRLESRADDGPEQKAVSRNLHDGWAAMREKRQEAKEPSTIATPPNPQPTTTTGYDPISTSTRSKEQTSLSEPTTASDSNQQTSTADSDDPETTVTAVTTVTTIVSYGFDSATDSLEATATEVNLPEAAATAEAAETASNEQSTMQTSTRASKTATTDSSTDLSLSKTASAGTLALPTDDLTVPYILPTESTATALPQSATGSASGTAALSDALSGVSEIVDTLTSDISSLSSLPPTVSVSVPTTSPTTPAPTTTASTSVPIISHPSGSSSETPIFIGSSLDLPTAVVSTQSPTDTTQSVMGAGSGESSISSSTMSTNSTATAFDPSSVSSTSTTATTSTSDNTHSGTYSSSSTSGSTTSDGHGWGGGNTSAPTASSSDSAATSDSGSGSMSPQTTGKIVGGVVGGVAGASIVFLLIWFFLRRRRKTGFFLGSPANRSMADDTGGGGLIGAAPTREMASRDSNKDTMFGAAYFAPAFMKRWRNSRMSAGEESLESSAPSSERGFQKVSGRKLPSMFDSGGGSVSSPTESEFSPTLPPVIPRSPFQSSQPPPSNPFSMPLDTSYTREAPEDGVAVMRPSPARTPTSGSVTSPAGGESSARAMPMNFPTPPPSHPIAIPKRPDALGRSHPSFDGSRGSRFTESL